MISTELNKNWRHKLMLLLIGINITLLFTFIWQAYQASFKHLKSTQSVLLDYAEMVGQQFAGKLKSNIGYWGLHDLRSQLIQDSSNNKSKVDFYFDKPNKGLRTQQKIIRDGIKSIYIYNTEENIINTLYGQENFIYINQIKAIDYSSINTFTVFHPNNQLGLETWAILAINKAHFYIIEFSTEMIFNTIEHTFNSSELLPKVLYDKISNSDEINLSLSVDNQYPVFKKGYKFDPQNTSYITINDDYGNLFKGYNIKVSFNEKIAEKLIIGGLPNNQLLKLLLLIVLTIFVLIATIIIYRKEQKLTQQRSQFIARVSHELRTPLTQIRMFSETLLLNRVNTESEKEKYLNIIHRESKHLSYLIDNILNMHENDNKNNLVHFDMITVLDEINYVIDNFKSIYKQKHVNFKITIEPEITLSTDKLKFRQIFLNIVDNAIKYGPKYQSININAYQVNSSLIISVCDQGPGIHEKDRKKVWEPYFRLERDEKKAINGTGIGLSITADNLKLINASYNIKDNDKVGVCFVITFNLNPNN